MRSPFSMRSGFLSLFFLLLTCFGLGFMTTSCGTSHYKDEARLEILESENASLRRENQTLTSTLDTYRRQPDAQSYQGNNSAALATTAAALAYAAGRNHNTVTTTSPAPRPYVNYRTRSAALATTAPAAVVSRQPAAAPQRYTVTSTTPAAVVSRQPASSSSPLASSLTRKYTTTTTTTPKPAAKLSSSLTKSYSSPKVSTTSTSKTSLTKGR